MGDMEHVYEYDITDGLWICRCGFQSNSSYDLERHHRQSHEVTHQLEDAGKKGRGQRVGFRNTYNYEVLLEDAAAIIKLHLPAIDDWQANELAYDLVLGVVESKYLSAC